MKKKNVTKPVENKKIAEIKADAIALQEKIESLSLKEIIEAGERVSNIARDIRWFLEENKEQAIFLKKGIGKNLKALKKLK